MDKHLPLWTPSPFQKYLSLITNLRAPDLFEKLIDRTAVNKLGSFVTVEKINGQKTICQRSAALDCRFEPWGSVF
jgi:hypothetical protein